ncbi:hypothetical protein [Frankia sp. EI5c]|uniref:hypothetical protein n=1 Tax=Frankia sp. EI5c TaxID=683316 RepID=UPI000FF87684|nr:hypothetical protein [Frankia sp. EI5c]
MKYVDAVLAGKISPDEILDYRTAWDSTSGEVSLHEFLGLTWSEYAMWVHDDRNLEYIFAARRGGKSLRQHLEDRRGADQIADELYKMSDFYDWD